MAPLIVVVSSVGRGADPAAAIFIVLVVVFLGFFIIAILLRDLDGWNGSRTNDDE